MKMTLGLLGVGTRSGGGAVSQRELTLGAVLAYATPGEACRANYSTVARVCLSMMTARLSMTTDRSRL